MEPEARIRRMADEGLISEKQAEMLRDSFAGRSADSSVAPQTATRLRGISLALVAVAVIIMIVILTSTGGQPGVIQDVSETLNQTGGQGEMNRTLSTILAISLLLIVPLLLWGGMHNSLVGREEMVFES